MTKRILAVIMAILILPVGLFAEVTSFNKDKIVAGVEWNVNALDLTDIKLLSVSGYGIDGDIVLYGNHFRTNQRLVNLGYELSDYITPYILVGQTNVSADVRVTGAISTPYGSGSADLLEIDYNGSPELTWGFGLKGDLIELPASVKLGYDVRFTANDGVEDTHLVNVLSDPIAARAEITYTQWDLALIAKKTIAIGTDRKIFQAVTPSVGVKFTDTTTMTKLSTEISGLALSTEQNYKSYLYSGVAGVNVKVTKNIDINVVGSYGGVKGVNAGVTVRF